MGFLNPHERDLEKRKDSMKHCTTSMKRYAIVIPRPTVLDVLHKHSQLAQQAYRRGNAAGCHGGKRSRYGKAERRATRREERIAEF